MHVYTLYTYRSLEPRLAESESGFKVNICRYKSAQLHYTSIDRFAAATQQESEDDEEIPIPQSLKPAALPLPIQGI